MSRAWMAALAFFILSALTGALFRAGLVFGYTGGLDLVNIRHAHSHTMYFGWATPALFLMIGTRMGVARLPQLLVWLYAASALAYVLFLLFGYSPVDIGPAGMPISVIAATINTVIWYVFVARYYRARRDRVSVQSTALWDVAVAFLILATLGALSLPLLVPIGVEDPAWSMALTHIFLDLFSEGWFVLGVLGLGYAALGDVPSRAFRAALLMVLLGLPFTFAMAMPQSMVPAPLELLSRIGSVLVGAGLLLLVGLQRRNVRGRMLWTIPLGLLATKALAQLAAGLAVGFWFAEYHGLRILYLHIMLVGFVSLGLVAAAIHNGVQVAGRRTWIFYGAVLLLILSLVPLTEPLFGGAWAFDVAMWIALLPAAAAAGMLAARVQKKPQHSR